jgi:hypothetical protein
MASEASRAVTAAVQWAIVGVAIGVVPTYVITAEHAKKEQQLAASAAASSAAAAVYAAWSAAPKLTCPAPAITVPTVVAVTQSGPPSPVRVAPPEPKDDDDAKMLIPMLGAMQQMMNGQGGQQPDINELMKNMPKK